MGWRLTPEEDAELRRLHALVQLGAAAPWLIERYTALRARDRRREVRELDDDDLVNVLPGQGTTETDEAMTFKEWWPPADEVLPVDE